MRSTNNPSSQDDIKDLVLIRHAQSIFNKNFVDYKIENNIQHLSWNQCFQLDHFNQQVSYAQSNIDAHITQHGKKQCLKAKQTLELEDIDIVLVSPHQRALETCRQIFGHRKIRVEVHPIMAQAFRFACDISNHIQQKIKQFPDYDFSHMNDHSELWFIQMLEKHHNEKVDQSMLHKENLSYKQKQQILLQLLQSKAIYQSASELRSRLWKIKEVLSQYRKKYNKIAIVSHFHIISGLVAKKFNEDDSIVDQQQICNAEPLFKSLEYLLQFK